MKNIKNLKHINVVFREVFKLSEDANISDISDKMQDKYFKDIYEGKTYNGTVKENLIILATFIGTFNNNGMCDVYYNDINNKFYYYGYDTDYELIECNVKGDIEEVKKGSYIFLWDGSI